MRHHDRRSAPGCQEKWPDRGIRRRSGPLERRKHCAAHLWASREPRRLLSSNPFQSSSGKCRSKDHLVSRTYLGEEGNNTPFFFIPVFLAGGCAYFLLPLNLFVVMVIASAASFYAHVFFDKEYHVEGSRLQRFAWFRRQQELHFVHHRHANSNFGVIHFFWDKILGTYQRPDAGA